MKIVLVSKCSLDIEQYVEFVEIGSSELLHNRSSFQKAPHANALRLLKCVTCVLPV